MRRLWCATKMQCMKGTMAHEESNAQGNGKSQKDGRLLQWNVIEGGDCWEGVSNSNLKYIYFFVKRILYKIFSNFICNCYQIPYRIKKVSENISINILDRGEKSYEREM